MFNFAPPTPVNVGAILASFEATRKRSREDAEYTRKQQEDMIARQHLGPALQGDPNALQALFSASPERGMAVAKYLDGKASAELNRKLIEARIARLAAGPAGRGGGRGAVAGVPLPPGAEEEEAPPAGMPSGLGPVAPGGMAGGIPGGPLPQRMPQGSPALGGGPAPSPGAAPYGLSDPNAAPAPAMTALPAAGALPGSGRLSPEALAEAIAARRAGMPTGGPQIASPTPAMAAARVAQARPATALEGELGAFLNPNGSHSTEVSVTINDPRLNGGRPTNIPLLVRGQSEAAIQRILAGQIGREEVEVAIARAAERVAGGLALPGYASIQEAERAASARSQEKGREMPGVVPVQAQGGGMVGQPQRGAPPVDYQSAAAAGYRPAMDGRGRPVVGPSGSVAMYPPGAKSARDIVFVPMKGPKAAGVPEEGGGTAGPAGKSVEAWALNVLLNGDPASPEYRAAYGKIAAGKVGPDGAIVQPDMRHFRPPVMPGGAPAEAPPQGAPQPGPGRAWSPERGEWVQAQGGPAPPAAPSTAPIGTPVVTEAPGGPKMSATERTKLRSMQVGAATLVKSLDDFAEAFEKADPSERLQTVAGMPTRLNTMWGLAAVLAKGEELMNLGVITGPDLGIIRRTVADPSTLAGAAADPKRVREQVKAVTDLIKFRMSEYERRSGMAPTTTPAPATPAATPAPDLRRKYNLE